MYHVSDYKPILHFDIKLLPYYWGDLVNLLSPGKLFENSKRDLDKDFGLHLKRLGFDGFRGLYFLEVPIAGISKLNNDLYTFGTNISPDEYSGSDVKTKIIKKIMYQILPISSALFARAKILNFVIGSGLPGVGLRTHLQ